MEFCVMVAFLGGLIVGLLDVALAWTLSHRKTPRLLTDPQPATQEFFDALIIVAISALPQSALVAIPWVYIGPSDVPAMLHVPAAVAASAMLVLWCWALIKIWRAGTTTGPQ